MFSALNQGSLVHILDKTDGLKYKVGEVIGVSQPNGNFGGAFGTPSFSANSTVNIKLKVDGNVVDYPEVPSNGTTASYNNGCVIICETKQGLVSEIETTLQNNKQILANREKYEKTVKDCEDLLKEISPQFAKDKELDDRITTLNDKFNNMTGKLDEILNMLSKR